MITKKLNKIDDLLLKGNKTKARKELQALKDEISYLKNGGNADKHRKIKQVKTHPTER